MSNEVKTRRLLNGEHQLLMGEKVVGRVWRWPKGTGRNGARKVGYGVNLVGWYWRKGDANQRSGVTATSAKTVREACQIAARVLAQTGDQS